MATKSYQLPNITKKGKEFIRNRCKVTFSRGLGGGNVLSGFYNYRQKDGKTQAKEVVSASIRDDSGNLITDVNTYAEQLIIWFEKYGQQYNMNPNVLAAQAYQESQYRAYAYPKTSTAMGITQFTVPTTFRVVIANNFGGFTSSEIATITNGISGNKFREKTYLVVKGDYNRYIDSNREESSQAIDNNKILFQNIVNNPQIMIKAQAIYLSAIAKFHNNLAASTLTLYFAGPNIKSNGESVINSDTYGNLLDVMRKKSVYKNTFNGGVQYARDILDILGDKKFNTIGFGFNFDSTEIKGSDIFDPSKGKLLRNQEA